MEKKSTKIAYFVALGIFIVLLVILGISYKDAPILIEDATTPFAFCRFRWCGGIGGNSVSSRYHFRGFSAL